MKALKMVVSIALIFVWARYVLPGIWSQFYPEAEGYSFYQFMIALAGAGVIIALTFEVGGILEDRRGSKADVSDPSDSDATPPPLT